jgi:CDP-diacylglycerol--glycerol-3-phosphate 3-phosphatidyltransferase
MWGVVVFGLASAVDYFRKFWRKVDNSIKLRRRNELITMERQKRRMDKAARKAGTKDVMGESAESTIRRPG